MNKQDGTEKVPSELSRTSYVVKPLNPPTPTISMNICLYICWVKKPVSRHTLLFYPFFMEELHIFWKKNSTTTPTIFILTSRSCMHRHVHLLMRMHQWPTHLCNRYGLLIIVLYALPAVETKGRPPELLGPRSVGGSK